MLISAFCEDMEVGYTLIGHSERRSKYGETDEDTALKVEKCQAAGLMVVLCIGELLEEREGGKTDEVNKRQLAAVIPRLSRHKELKQGGCDGNICGISRRNAGFWVVSSGFGAAERWKSDSGR